MYQTSNHTGHIIPFNPLKESDEIIFHFTVEKTEA